MKHEINLLPVDPPKKTKKNLFKRKGLLLLAGSILALLVIYGILFFLDWSCQKEIQQIEEIMNSKSEYQIIYTNLTDQKETLEYRTQLQEAINTGKDQPLKALAEIQNVLPAEVMVSSYIFQDDLLSISGETRKNEEILRFKEKLTAIDCFKVINMVNSSKKKEPNIDNKNPSGEEVWEFTFDIEMNEVL